jgi:hypothetical protein
VQNQRSSSGSRGREAGPGGRDQEVGHAGLHHQPGGWPAVQVLEAPSDRAWPHPSRLSGKVGPPARLSDGGRELRGAALGSSQIDGARAQARPTGGRRKAAWPPQGRLEPPPYQLARINPSGPLSSLGPPPSRLTVRIGSARARSLAPQLSTRSAGRAGIESEPRPAVPPNSLEWASSWAWPRRSAA